MNLTSLSFQVISLLEALFEQVGQDRQKVLIADRAGAFHGRHLPIYLQQHFERLNVVKLLFGEAGYNKSDLDAYFAVVGQKYRSLALLLEKSVDTPTNLFAALMKSLNPDDW